MNLNDSGWFGTLQVSGSTKIIRANGSPLAILKELIGTLQQMNPKDSSSGKSITISLVTQDGAQGTLSAPQNKLVRELESQLDTSDSSTPLPFDGESYEEFYDRLITFGLEPAGAQFLANDWFEREQDQTFARWLNDPKAIHFRKLNTNQQAYEQAMPSEYELLKQHVLKEYPELCASIIFRTA